MNFISSLRLEVNNYFKDNNIEKGANIHMYMKSGFMLSLYFIPYVLMISGAVSNPSLFWIMWMIMGLGMAGIGMSIMHDGNHSGFSKNKSINKIMGVTLQMIGGTDKIWKIQHNKLHHKYTNVHDHDPDVSPIKLLRFSPDAPYNKIYRFQFIYAWFLYGLMTFSFATIKEFKQLTDWKKNSIISLLEHRKLMFELIGWKIIYYIFILVIPLLILDLTFSKWFMLFFLMHFIAGFILALVFQTAHIMPECEHQQYAGKPDPNTWAINQILTTANYAPNSKIFSWFIGGLNYQVEHHLFPGICHVHYSSIAKIVKKVTKEHDLPYHCQKTFISAVYEHGKMLYKLGLKPA
jgi:linoleoyl-CoA desaturase